MAQDFGDGYKEGVDFVIVDKGGYKTRRFLTKAEKAARTGPKPRPQPAAQPAKPAKATVSTSNAPSTSPRPKPRPAPAASTGPVSRGAQPVKPLQHPISMPAPKRDGNKPAQPLNPNYNTNRGREEAARAAEAQRNKPAAPRPQPRPAASTSNEPGVFEKIGNFFRGGGYSGMQERERRAKAIAEREARGQGFSKGGMVAKPKAMAAFEKRDEKMDRKKGIKEGSKLDMKKDAKMGFPYPKTAKKGK